MFGETLLLRVLAHKLSMFFPAAKGSPVTLADFPVVTVTFPMGGARQRWALAWQDVLRPLEGVWDTEQAQ